MFDYMPNKRQDYKSSKWESKKKKKKTITIYDK